MGDYTLTEDTINCGEIDNKPPLIEKLKRERVTLQSKVDSYNKAIAALEKNPDFEVMMNILGKVIRIY